MPTSRITVDAVQAALQRNKLQRTTLRRGRPAAEAKGAQCIRVAETAGMLVRSDTELCVRNKHNIWHKIHVLQRDRAEYAVN